MKFEGVFAAIVCPMDDNGMVDENSLFSHVSKLSKTFGMNGILCNGHAGENHVLSLNEKKKVIEISRRASSETKIIAGLNSEEEKTLSKEARDAELSGADAVMVFPPFSWSLGHDSEMALKYHKTVLNSTNLPVFIYQSSIHSGGMRYSNETLESLCRLPRIAGIKEGSWEFCAYEKTLKITQKINPNIPVMASGDEHLFPCFALGTQGSIVSLASIIPDAVIALYESIKCGRLEIAKKLHEPIQSLANLIYGSGGSASQATLNLKLALANMGEIAGKQMRAPVATMPYGMDKEIHDAMSQIHAVMEATSAERHAILGQAM